MPRPLKVLHIVHAFSHGGLENGIVSIINGSPPGIQHELCLLTSAGEFIDRLKNSVRYYELHKKPGNSLKTIFQLARVIRQSGANIVHTRNWAAFDGVLASCLCPGVEVLHGEHGRDMGDRQGTNPRRNLGRRLLNWRIQQFSTVSEDLRRWLIDIVGIPPSKIVLIRNGVDIERFRPHRDPELRRGLGIAHDELVVGTIGRLDPVKNHEGLLRAVALLGMGGRQPRLVIVGDGPARRDLERLTVELGLSGAVILAGYRSDVDRFYGVFDVFVLNSFAEGMSNTLLEAMASGLPVICTAVGAAPEIVKGGERGWLLKTNGETELCETLRRVASDSRRREMAAANARAYVETFCSLERMVSTYAALYEATAKVRSSHFPPEPGQDARS